MNIVKYLLISGIGAVLFLNLFGLAFAMPMDSDGHMVGCPLVVTATMCQMSPFEHISAWQNMFTTTAPNGIAALLLLLAFVAVAWFETNFGIRLYQEIRGLLRYCDRTYYLPTRHFLQEAFSNGIIHSKVLS